MKLKIYSYETVLDAFGGTGSVSYSYKKIGKEVTYNDILKALLYNADNLSNIRRFINQIYPDASKEVEKPNTFEQFGNSLDSEGFSREEIAKKISPKAIGNETANIVQYPNIRVAENLLQLRNNKRAIPQNNSNR